MDVAELPVRVASAVTFRIDEYISRVNKRATEPALTRATLGWWCQVSSLQCHKNRFCGPCRHLQDGISHVYCHLERPIGNRLRVTCHLCDMRRLAEQLPPHPPRRKV